MRNLVAMGLGCVKTCTREKDAELFSLSSSPDYGRSAFLFFKLTVSGRNFYWQIQLQEFSHGLGHVWTAPGWQGLSSRVQQWSVRPCVRPLSARFT